MLFLEGGFGWAKLTVVEAVRRGEGLDEADDPINAWAFNRKANPMHARLNAVFSSDIGYGEARV